MKDSRTKDILKRPKDLKKGFHIYYSEELLEKCELKAEYDKFDGLFGSRKMSFQSFKLNMVLIINYLTHNIPNYDSKKLKNIHSDRFKHLTSERCYRKCLDILKDKKILYVLTKDGGESYCVSRYSKAYRFNYNIERVKNHKIGKILVDDPRILRKFGNIYRDIQVPKQVMEKFELSYDQKFTLKENVSFKNAKNDSEVAENNKIYDKSVYVMTMFVPTKSKSAKEWAKKWWLNRKMEAKTGFSIASLYLKRITYDKIYEVFMDILNGGSTEKGYLVENKDIRKKITDRNQACENMFKQLNDQMQEAHEKERRENDEYYSRLTEELGIRQI